MRSPVIWKGLSAERLHPGPVWFHDDSNSPPLSWSQPRRRGSYHVAMSDALHSLLECDSTLGASPKLPSLIRRVVASGASRSRTDYRPVFDRATPPPNHQRILLIDERRSPINSDRSAFSRMLEYARTTHPAADILIWPSAGRRYGQWQLRRLRALPKTARIVDRRSNFFSVLEEVSAVYTVEAPEGMDAIVAGFRPHVFGCPFYAGLGHTNDVGVPLRSFANPSIEALFDAIYLRLARYVDPDTGAETSLEYVLECIELQRSTRKRFLDLRVIEAHGFQIWKRRFAAPFLQAGSERLYWHRRPRIPRSDSMVAIWGARNAHPLCDESRVIRIEDGFFHSLGLGSDMSAPLSQVIDRKGIYFDAKRPSELTHILNEGIFDKAELDRAAKLRHLVIEYGVSKYNLGRKLPQWEAPKGRDVILVVGQVADDASIRLGSGDILSAEELLQHVRANHPEAFVVYKPHPDVLAGNRTGLVDACQNADVVDAEADLVSLLERVDEVHTISSLAGFEGLLRQKRVYAYGYPFYAGWGLTHDVMQSVPWRHRSLTLDELVAGVLIRYPVYWNWEARLFSTPEAVVRTLARHASRPLNSVKADPLRPWRKGIRWVSNLMWYLQWEILRSTE